MKGWGVEEWGKAFKEIDKRGIVRKAEKEANKRYKIGFNGRYDFKNGE